MGGIEKEGDTEVEEYTFGEETDKDVYVYVKDKGSDEESEVTTTYEIKTLKDGTTEKYNEDDTVTLTENGTYEITIKTEDEAGNVSEDKVVVKINKVIPVLSLKHNDASGADYVSGTWTKDDLYGQITIDTSETGKTVEKYQYSYDKINWEDISETPVEKPLDYTTTFPMTGAEKPEWINGPINNGTYYFEVQSDGKLKPNNSGINSKTANSYFEIDLTNYPDVNLELTINATISSENADRGYATITENATAPTYSTITGRFIYVSGTTKTTDHKTTLTGGKKYYLHIGYRKDGSVHSNQDTFTINSITLKSDKLGKGLKFYEYAKEDNTVTFKLQEEIEKEIYIRAVYEDGKTSKVTEATSIKIDKTAPVIEKANGVIISKSDAKIDVTVKEEGSGLQGYYISTETTAPTEASSWTEQILKEFTIEGLSTETTYYLWVKDKVGHISEKQEIVIGTANYSIDDVSSTETLAEAIAKASETGGSTIKLLNDYTDESTVAFDRNVTFDVQGYTLTRTKTITINSSKIVEMTGTGKITSGTSSVSTIINNGTLTIKNNITIENKSTSSSYAPIYSNYSYAVTNINDNVRIIGYYRGIFNNYGTVNIHGGYIEATHKSSAYGIYNNSYSAKIYINGGEIRGYYGINNYNSSSLVEITGGKVVGTGANGIISYGVTNIYGGRIEGKTYGVYSNNSDKVTIGRQQDELSTTNPSVYGGTYGIYMDDESYSFNFYNGVIISNTKETAYRGILNPRTGYMPYTYFDEEVEQKYCTILVPTVENITMEATPTEYTNGDVMVKITYPYNQENTKQYSEDGISWNYTDNFIENLTITENKTVYARTINESGIVTNDEQIVINNIDKEKPVVTVSPTETNYIVIEENDTVDINLTIKATDTGESGLNVMQYGWAKEGEEVTYIDFTNEITLDKNNLGIGQYNLYLKVTDKAGNEAELRQMRYNVKYQEPVCKIGTTKYLTIQSAVEVCSKTAGTKQTTIEMLKSTDEEFNTYEGQNIILDLKGYTVGSSKQDIPICTNNAVLQIIDSNSEKTGKLESLNGTAILNNGTIIIGDNSTSIEPNTPTIYGKQIGIKNNETFEFYDGKIQGITPIQGKVTKTPEEYGPVSTDYNNGITTIQLGIVTGYEARIEWMYYTKVQQAIDATNTNKRETVIIIKDIQLQEILEVSAEKDFVLDLDGYIITATVEDRIINNYGIMEIIDSSIEQTGKMEIESGYGIYNYGILRVKGSTISSSRGGIYNNSTGSVTVSGGTISGNSYGIYNNSTGNVTVKGGTINSNSYGIYNNSTGSVIVEDGIINSSSTSSNYISCYGIYNNSTGSVTVEGGTISCSNGYKITSYGIYNVGTGSVTVNGGVISSSGGGSYGIYNNSIGNIEVTAGTISNKSITTRGCRGIYNSGSGSITVSGGTISGSGYHCYGIYNESRGNVIVSGGMISNSADWTCGIYNDGTGSLTVSGGTINCSSGTSDLNDKSCCSYGICNNSTGSIIVSGGTISTINNSYDNDRSYGIYNNSTGSVIIGIKQNQIISQEEPSITGNLGYGVYNLTGNVCFYDGIIKGSQRAIIGNITEITENYEIENKIIDNLDSIYLVKATNAETIVKIGENEFYNITEAIESIKNDKETTIEVLRNFELKEPLNCNKNIILDLKGYSITNNYYRVKNTGKLKITDTSDAQTGKIQNNETILGIINEGETLEIIEGTISSEYKRSNTSYGIYNNSTGNVIVNGGTINSNSSKGSKSTSYGIYNNSTGNVIVNGGTINSSSSTTDGDNASYGIYNVDTGRVTVSGGTISCSNSNNTQIDDDNNSYGIYNESAGRVTVSGGTITCINGYSHGNYSYGIYNESTGNVTLSGGTISCSGSDSYGIYNDTTGGITVSEGTISCNSSSNNSNAKSYGIYNYKGSTTVSGGIISCTSNSNSYGIYNYTGTITIGIKGDGLVSQEKPNIKGKHTGTSTSYGIYNTSGGLYFYDGKIEGTTKAVYDTITQREDNTELKYNTNETILTLTTELTDIAQIRETTYKTLKEAITAVGETQTTIKLLRNAAFTNQDTVITIPNTKNIILDLNGYKVTSSIPETLIQNEGTLEIIDTSANKTGTLISNTEKTINNIADAKLKISSGIIENRSQYSIYNEGELIVQEGKIYTGNENSSYDSYGIYNKNSGSVTVSGGIISGSTNYGIYNESIGSVKVTGGTINSKNCGIYNKSTGSIILEEGTISDADYGIYNISTGSVIVSGGTISSRCGICNSGTGSITVSGGIISGSSNISSYSSYGIYNSGSGTIIIGTKGNGLIEQEEPYITGEYGINNTNGNLYLYDGKIEGTTQAISGSTTEIEDMTELLVNKSSTEIIQLQTKATNVVSVNGVEYDSIKEAVLACGITENTIKILRDADPGATIVIEEGQNITIDLNGYTVKNYQEITNKGTLKIIDTSSGKTGKLIGLTGTVVLNEGIMELNGGSISDTGYGINNKGTLTINGGTVTNNTYGVYNNNAGTINIMAGTISSNTYGIYNCSGTTEITGGNITLNENGIYVLEGIANIASTGITNNTYGIYNIKGTTNIKEGSQISSTTGIYNSNGTINIGETGTMNSSSPVIIGEQYGLTNETSAIVNMYDGQIKGKIGATQGYITYTETGYVVGTKTEGEYMVDYLALAGTIGTVAQVNGIDFSNLQSAINSVIGEEAQTITLTNGLKTEIQLNIAEGQNIILDMNGKTITSDLNVTITNNGNLTIIDTSGKNVGKISSTVGIAIVNTGILTLGQDDGTVIQDLINIDGTTIGIENSGTLNFYDGTINGASALSGSITSRATGYVIRTTTVDSKERYYLSL